MGGSRVEMRAVDLVEVDEVEALGAPLDGPWDPGSGDVPAGRDVRAGRPRPRRRVRPREVAVAAVVAALAVGGTSLVSERRDSERLAALADVPGVLRPLEAPVGEQWRSGDRLWPDVTHVAGLLIGVTDVRFGVNELAAVAIDATTGAVRWRTQVVPASSAPAACASCVAPEAPPGTAEDERLLVCLAVDRLEPSPQDLSVMVPADARVLVLRASTGEVLSERVVDPSTSVNAIDDDVVVKDTLDDGRVRVRRTDPLGTQERWTFLSPDRDRPAGFSWVIVDDGLVVVPGEAGWVLTGEGEVVHEWSASRPAAAGWADVLHGRVLVQPMRDLFGELTVVDLESGASFRTDGYTLRPSLDDGSTGDLVLVQSAQGEGLIAYEAGSGRPRWTVSGEDAGGTVVVDGMVVRSESESMRAVDARSGTTVWEVPIAPANQYGLFTDGRVVLRTERDAADGTVLVARDLDDGRVRWSTDVGEDLDHLFVVDGRLVGTTSEGLVSFGPQDA